MANPVRFFVNDRLVEERDAPPTTTLLDYLRGPLGLTGTKEGCAEGDCGACTVAILDPAAPGGAAWRAVNSCLVFLPSLHGKVVVTVEGIADGGRPHPAQAAMVERLGSQCGYCTPGFVMSLFEGTYRDDLAEPWQVDDQIAGNLCRCTGYRPIRDAARDVSGSRPDDRFRERLATASPAPAAIDYAADGGRFVAPASVPELLGLLAAEPSARIVAGGTDVALEVTKFHREIPLLVSLEAIPSLAGTTRAADGGWRIGATTRLTDLEAFAAREIPLLARMLRYFGARQIKHRATIGGNLANASPIGDLAPVLLALGASVRLVGPAGERELPLDAFFVGYRKTALAAGEFLESVVVPAVPAGARLGAYKVSRRRELDISAVSASFRVETDGAGVVTQARLAFGGMAAVPARARGAEGALRGRRWDAPAVEGAVAALGDDFTPIDDLRASAWYRRTVAGNLLRGFFLETAERPFVALDEGHASTVILPGGGR